MAEVPRQVDGRLMRDLFKTRPRLAPPIYLMDHDPWLQGAVEFMAHLLKSDGCGCVKTAAVSPFPGKVFVVLGLQPGGVTT